MGTICAPPYANIFMGKFENDQIYPLFGEKCPLYLRFIDDIFGIWTRSKQEFFTAIEILYQCHHSIKFDFEISPINVNFLDTTVFVGDNGKLKTKVFSKPTDRQNFLHRRSEHPESLKKNIPYRQLLRGELICSEQNDFLQQADRFIQKTWIHKERPDYPYRKSKCYTKKNYTSTNAKSTKW